jgi:FkbM family methyltransferase
MVLSALISVQRSTLAMKVHHFIAFPQYVSLAVQQGLNRVYTKFFLSDGPFVYQFTGYTMLLPSPRQSVIAQAIARDGVWEQEVTQFFRSKLTPDMVVIDVGAHIGYYTLLCASIAKSVIGFEVNTDAIAALEQNIKLNGFTNVSIIQKALFSRNGYLQFKRDQIKISEQATSAQTSVECVRLDDLAASGNLPTHVDLIKIDVEGAELDVICGARAFINTCRPHIIIEVHSRRLPDFSHSASEMLAELQRLGYTYTPIDTKALDFSRHNNITLYCEPL